jgi:hypothetical protein
MLDREVAIVVSGREVVVVHHHFFDISSLLDTFEVEVEAETGRWLEIACLSRIREDHQVGKRGVDRTEISKPLVSRVAAE